MDEENQIDDKLNRKRELTNARVKKYRKKKRTESQELNSSMQDNPTTEEMQNKQVEENNDERKRAMAKERSRMYRERKRLNNLKSIHHVVHDLQFPRPLHENPPLVLIKNQRTTIHDSQIAGTSTNMSIPLVVRDDSENLNRIRENILSPLNEENQHVDVDDYLVPLEDQVRASPTLNVQLNRSSATYSTYARHSSAHIQFHKQFIQNKFGYACKICDRLWFEGDLKNLIDDSVEFVRTFLPNVDEHSIAVCSTCRYSIQKKSIPNMAVYNGFKYPTIPDNLRNCPLDLVSERLISPRIPFMQIRRLRHVHGQYGIYGQVINVPVEVNTMVNKLPRNIDDDRCIYVHIKRKKIHKSSFLQGLINKRTIKEWLKYLVNTPLYITYNITIDEQFFDNEHDEELPLDDPNENNEKNNGNNLEDIPIEESLLAQQQTVMWNDDLYLRIAPGENNLPISLLFDEHAEELSFPSIYLGQFRQFREGLAVTPFMMATSELRRSDRRGVTPHHLLYIAMKIMRIRVRDSLTVAFKHVGKKYNITKEKIQSEDYIQNCIESNLAFLRSIPNSAWYWSQRKKDLFAMIRQLGKPTVFFTISANEIGWLDLLQLLYKLKTHVCITKEEISKLHYMMKSTLINEDAVTCAIYFNKLVNVVMNILQSKTCSPFRKYRIRHYFKRIEFQHRGSPHAHILAWLDNAPKDALNEDYDEAIELIDTLISVSTAEASGNIKLQTHKHTFTCYKKITAKKAQKCRFEAPFMPCKKTMILTPMKNTEEGFVDYKKRYAQIRVSLENEDFENMDNFYNRNGINSDEDYYNVIRAGITRPKVYVKREPSEKWHNPFNPFIFNIVQSNTDFQFITEEYSCAAYVVEYVNKTNRGVSDLQRKIIETMNEHPEFDIIDITKNISVNVLNHTEITSQEAAWYLLREPMSKTSVIIVYIPTVWPIERQRIRKTMKELSELDDDCIDVWKENWFDKYEKRPEYLETITLAQFVSKYTQNREKVYIERHEPKIIRYRNYDMAIDFNEYKREMVTLHLPFRNEEEEILAEMKFITIYDDNENIILQRRKEFESNIDIDKTIQICRELCREETPVDGDEIQDVVNRFPEENPFQQLYNNPNSDINSDLRLATLNKLGAIAKKKENIMSNADFCAAMRMANEKQRMLLTHVIYRLLSNDNNNPLQIFFTGPAGCGKTFVIRLIMEIYNRFSDSDGYCNAYITCASTGKAAVAIDGTTVHTALKISLSKLLPLSIEVAHQYRSLFRYVRAIIIDEISMIGAELLEQIDLRLKQITGNFASNFGNLDVILIGDLRQLPPVRATPIYKQIKRRMTGPTVWRDLKFYELTEVMRQANRLFSNALTKVGNGENLNTDELALIESRFVRKEAADIACPHGIRLFFSNTAVEMYNNSVLNIAENKVTSVAKDVYTGCHNAQQEAFVKQKLHKMSIIDTGGLPYQIIFVLDKYYMLTTNIDVSDGLANGAVGKLCYIDYDNNREIIRLWLIFPNPEKVGRKIRSKVSGYIADHNISRYAVPIARRSCTVPLNNNKTINAKRNHFPVVSACAITIHKSQGATFDEIVYEYEKTHSQQLVYVALSRVTRIEGLYIVTENNDPTFYHGRRESTSVIDIQNEFKRLSLNRLQTVTDILTNFISNRTGILIFSLNCQSLRAHALDLDDSITQRSTILLLSETWINNEEDVGVPNFQFVAKFKRPDCRAAGVAILKNKRDTSTIVTSHMDIGIRNPQSYGINVSPIGEICIAKCTAENKQIIVMVAIYISPNQTIKNIIEFIHENLLVYTKAGSAFLKQNHHTLPMILSGDFNVDFTKDTSMPLVDFLKSTLHLNMSNDLNESTTKYGTTIDGVFFRYLANFHSKVFISYFSYHKPIVSFLEYNTITDDQSERNLPE